jgi:hypothetical protein
VLAEAEAIARELGDPVLMTQVLQTWVNHEIDGERLATADALADEAIRWARAAGDEWELAEALAAKAVAAPTIGELRERVEAAASLLVEVGNVHELANLLTDAAYAALCFGHERDAAELAARAAPITLALGSPYPRLINSGNLGLAALLTGQARTAADAFREELALCRELVVRPAAWEGLRGLAAIAATDGDDERAATLAGAAAAYRYDQVEDPVEARLDAAFLDPARARVGAEEWDAAARAGGSLTFEEAVAYALEEPRGR